MYVCVREISSVWSYEMHLHPKVEHIIIKDLSRQYRVLYPTPPRPHPIPFLLQCLQAETKPELLPVKTIPTNKTSICHTWCNFTQKVSIINTKNPMN